LGIGQKKTGFLGRFVNVVLITIFVSLPVPLPDRTARSGLAFYF